MLLANQFFIWCLPFGYLYLHYISIAIASIAYNHPVYGVGIPTHNHSVVSTRPWLLLPWLNNFMNYCYLDAIG